MKHQWPQYPFMVFAESLPEATRLADSNTPLAERAQILREVNAVVDVVKSVVDRNTQQGRHEKSHAARKRVMDDLRRDARGRPLRGEPSRLARDHGVPVVKVRKWIEQLKNAPLGSEAIPSDWRTVYYGKALRFQRSTAARRSKKREG